MKHYKQKKEKKPTERVSFYIALSICMMAVGFALWSAYANMNSEPETGGNTYFSSLSTENAPVAQEMTGVTEAETEPEAEDETEAPAAAETMPAQSMVISETLPTASDDDDNEDVQDPLQAVLRVSEDLVYPVKSRLVTKAYSEEAVYNKTLRDHRAHTGCDFAAEPGENVYAMCGGTVKNISVSELYGVIIEVDSGDYVICYCGLDTEFVVEKGDEVAAGDTIGTVGQVPCESEDEPHVHIEIRVGERTVDPLSVIDSES